MPETECEDVPSQQCGEVCENIYWCKVQNTNQILEITRDSSESLFTLFNVEYFRNVSNKRYDDQKTEIFKQQNRVTRAYTSILILVSLNSFPIPLLLSKLVSCQNQYIYQSIIL